MAPGGGGSAGTRVCLVLEGTAAAGGSWAAARQAVVDPLLRRLEAGGGGGGPPAELAIVVCRGGPPFSAAPVERAGWTADLTRVRQGLDAVRFQGGGGGGVRLADALAEACFLFQQPSALGPPEALQQHCLLACHSAACGLPLPWAPTGQPPQGPGTVGPEELVRHLAGAGVSLSLLLQSSPRPPAHAALTQLFAAAAQAQGQRQPQQQLLAACQVAAPAGVAAFVSPAWPALAAAVEADAQAQRLQPVPAAAANAGAAESPALLAPSPGQAAAAAAADTASPGSIPQLPTPPSAWGAPSPPQASVQMAAAPQQQQAGLPPGRLGPGHPGQMLPPPLPQPQHGLAHAQQQWQQQQQLQQQQQKAFRTIWSGEVLLSPAAARAPAPVQLLLGSAVVGAAFAADASAWPRSLVIEQLVDYRTPAISELSRTRGAAVQGRFLPRPEPAPPASTAALQQMVDACLGGLVPLLGGALVFVASPGKPGSRGQFRLGFVVTPPWS